MTRVGERRSLLIRTRHYVTNIIAAGITGAGTMAQVNIEFDDDTVRELDRIAAKQSVRRPELLRRTVRELIVADGQGREPFAILTQEFKAEEVAHLAREVRALATELDRVMRANAKREAGLLKAIAAFEADAAAARERGAREVAEALERALEPFRAEIEELKAENAQLRTGFETALASQPRLDAIDQRLERVEKQPRNEYSIVLGQDAWSLAALMLAILSLLAAGGFMAFLLAGVWHGFGMTFVDRVVHGNQGICELIQYRTGYSDCRVPGVHDEAPAPIPMSIETPALPVRHQHRHHRG